MTADDETRTVLRDLAAGQRDLAAGQRDHSRRFDGLSSRMDDFERMLGAVTLQTSLAAGDIVEITTKLASLDTAKWDETTRKVNKLEGAGEWVRRRGVAIFLAVLAGGGGVKVIEALLS